MLNHSICWVPNKSWDTGTLLTRLNAILMWQYWARHIHFTFNGTHWTWLRRERKKSVELRIELKWRKCVYASIQINYAKGRFSLAIAETQSPMLMFYLFAIMVQLIIRLDDFAAKQHTHTHICLLCSPQEQWLLAIPTSKHFESKSLFKTVTAREKKSRNRLFKWLRVDDGFILVENFNVCDNFNAICFHIIFVDFRNSILNDILVVTKTMHSGK